MDPKVKRERRRGYTRVSSKHQVTIPKEAMVKAGLKTGDRLRVEARKSGEVALIRERDLLDKHAGPLTGVYGQEYVDELRDEWQ